VNGDSKKVGNTNSNNIANSNNFNNIFQPILSSSHHSSSETTTTRPFSPRKPKVDPLDKKKESKKDFKKKEISVSLPNKNLLLSLESEE